MNTGSVLDRPKLAGGVSPQAQNNFRDYQKKLYRDRVERGYSTMCAAYRHMDCFNQDCVCRCHR